MNPSNPPSLLNPLNPSNPWYPPNPCPDSLNPRFKDSRKKKFIKKSCLRKKFWKDGSKFDEILLKTQRNKCLLHLRKVLYK